jgi:hypothetical protein
MLKVMNNQPAESKKRRYSLRRGASGIGVIEVLISTLVLMICSLALSE